MIGVLIACLLEKQEYNSVKSVYGLHIFIDSMKWLLCNRDQ